MVVVFNYSDNGVVLSPSFTSLVFMVVIFVAVMIAVVFDLTKPNNMSDKNVKKIVPLLTVLILYLGFKTFNTTWAPSRKVAALAEALGTTTSIFLLIVSLIGCLVGIYAMYILAHWIVSWAAKLKSKPEIIENLKCNCFFPVSAMAFFYLNAAFTTGSWISFLIAVLISTQIPSIWRQTKNNSLVLRLFSILTSIGICIATITVDNFENMRVLSAIIAVPFVYVCILTFWNCIIRILSESMLFSNLRTGEIIIYAGLLVMTLGYMVFSFTQTQAFYGTERFFNIIYTSDSPILVKGNVYLSLTHPENDLRQPLFAVFSAPFVGIPYLLARLIGASSTVQAIMMNSVQVLLLFVANFILTKILKLDFRKRICFMVLMSCTYTQLLFTLMMEQYIIAYFWVIFCMYLIVEKRQPKRIVLWGAGGTLLISMILLPFMSDKSPIKEFKAWVVDTVKYGVEFIVLMLMFCRFDVINGLMVKISELSTFTGKTVTLSDKIYQYTEFVRNCYIAPNASIRITNTNHISWQMNTVESISYVGIVIFLLAVGSAIWNRDKKSSLLAAGWVGFSVIMLLGLGWGTSENGLILYALYFGWAFFVLLFQLVEKIEYKLNIKYLLPVVTGITVVVLLLVNIPAIIEMICFGISYYPV